MNGGVAESIVQVPNPGFGDTIPRNLGMMEKSDVVKECRQSTIAAEDDHQPTINVVGHIGIDDGHVEDAANPPLALRMITHPLSWPTTPPRGVGLAKSILFVIPFYFLPAIVGALLATIVGG